MSRIYFHFCVAIAAAFASTAHADVTYTDAKDAQFLTIRLTVTPADVPVPALRYRLMPREIDLKPGNAAPYYYRAQIELRDTMKVIRDSFDLDAQLNPWFTVDADATPIAQLPLDQVRKASQMFDSIYDSHLKPAFKRRSCDWELDLQDWRGIELISVRLEEFQRSREIARMISLRTRLAIAERRYADAVELMGQNYRLGRDVAKGPLIVCGLIGIAINNMTNRTLLELIANPDSPNMYWALGELPQPPIDLRPAIRFEMDFGPRMFPIIHHSETTDRSSQEWNRLFTQAVRDVMQLGGKPVWFGNGAALKESAPGLAATALGLIGYTHAKERLIADGMDPARVEKMAVGQVIAIYTERNYRRFADDWENLWQVPFAQSEVMSRQLDQKLYAARPFSAAPDREILPLMNMLLPALQASRAAQVRLDRDVASLKVIEALRMYAAKHDGRLPARLEDIDQIPVPKNPATGKQFEYRLEGTTAILELPPSDRLSSGNCRYEIKIAPRK